MDGDVYGCVGPNLIKLANTQVAIMLLTSFMISGSVRYVFKNDIRSLEIYHRWKVEDISIY